MNPTLHLYLRGAYLGVDVRLDFMLKICQLT